MRTVLCNTLVSYAARREFVFLTGDLGFMALEPLVERAGPRFINAGVAEQNMVSVAAGMARVGLRPWVYSIAPFVFARPFEQIRNDVCLHRLPVCLVGNGGGFAYGAMGPTHHAIDDYGALLALPHLSVYVPAFAEDVPMVAARIQDAGRPAYLRLGRDERPAELQLPAYAPWRRLLSGAGPCVLVVGPLVGPIVGALSSHPAAERPSVWVLSELPLTADSLPEAFIADVRRADHLLVVEEHVAHGSAGQMLATALLERGQVPRRFEHRAALGYRSGSYGSQKFHRKESQIDAESILASLVSDAHVEEDVTCLAS